MNILELLLFIVSIPSLSLFIHKCYEPDMIFRRIYLYMIDVWMKNWRRKDRWRRKIIKPFLCVYCFNVWLTIFSFFIFMKISILFLPLLIGLTYILLEFLMKITK